MEGRGYALVIEDDDDIRELLVALLKQSGFEAHSASTGLEGVRRVTAHSPVVVTVDLGLPDIDGFEVIRRIRRVSDAYILMLTARDDEIDTLQGLEAGADDYLTKPFRPRELRARIDAMLRRPRVQPTPTWAVTPVPPPPGSTVWMHQTPSPSSSPPRDEELVYRLDGLELHAGLYRVVVDGEEVQLTPSEFALLRTLLVARRLVRSKVQLFRILRDEDPDADTFVSDADERTIEVHMGNLRRKLKDDPREPRWVETVRGVGYRSAGIPDVGV